MKKNFTRIPNRLREHRRLLGYTQSDVMRRLHLRSTGMISRWERGETMPSSDNLLKLSILYKTQVCDLYYDLIITYQSKLYPDEAKRLLQILKDDSPPNRGP